MKIFKKKKKTKKKHPQIFTQGTSAPNFRLPQSFMCTHTDRQTLSDSSSNEQFRVKKIWRKLPFIGKVNHNKIFILFSSFSPNLISPKLKFQPYAKLNNL